MKYFLAIILCFCYLENGLVQGQECHGEGQICAGIAGFQCCAGLNCTILGPIFPDVAGTCQKSTDNNQAQYVCKKRGEMCGGIAGFVCCPGLKCKLKGDYPDASGTCKRIK